jgi:hypothetical protein
VIALASFLGAIYVLGAWYKLRLLNRAVPNGNTWIKHKRALLWFVPYSVYYRQDLIFLRRIKDLGTDD